VIERVWVDVNTRVNYPIKTALIEMEVNHEINLENDHIKFCVSWFTVHVANVGTTTFVSAWNEHRISGELYCMNYMCMTTCIRSNKSDWLIGNLHKLARQRIVSDQIYHRQMQ